MKVENKKSSSNGFMDFWIPNKNDSQKRKIGKIVTLAAVALIIVSAIIIVLIMTKYKGAEDVTNTYSDLYDPSSQVSDASSSEPDKVEEPKDEIDPETGVLKELSELYKTNDDVVGHISIPDTKLSYPVVQGDDNGYYLDKTLYKEYNAFGIPFADYRATFSEKVQSSNISIYGHSANDGSFFAAVKEYKNVDYYKKHPVLTFDTIYGKGKFKIIGLFMENVNLNNKDMFAYHDFVDKSDDAHFMSFVDNVKKRSYFTTSVDVKPDDSLVTLSTCDVEINKTDYRVALVARKIRPGESEEVDVSTAVENKDQLMPAGWVAKKGKKNPFS